LPEFVQLIIVPFLRAEDVDDYVDIIQQQPAGIGASLAVVRQDALYFKGFFNLVADSVKLPSALTGADNKIIRKAGNFMHIQQDDVAGLLIAGGVDGLAG
jgi:hypothetical protein